MSDEKTARSVRATPEVFDRLKKLAQDKGLDQGAALEALLNTWDIQEAKGLVPERAADVADFDAHIQGIQSAFLRSLDLAKSAEQRARVAYQVQIDAMTNANARLEKELKEALERAEKAEIELDTVKSKLKAAEQKAKSDELMNALYQKFVTEAKAKPEKPPKGKKTLSMKTESGTTKEADTETGTITETA